MAATGTGSDEGTRPRGGGAARARFDVVALVASAGGLSALNQVLLHLPNDFCGPVVIVQHLGGANSTLVDILRRRSPCRWSGSPTTRPSSQAGSSSARPSACWRSCPTATARRARSSPPHAAPDRPHHMLRPIDWFLASVAESYGQGAMAVALTGMTRPPGGRSPASASTNGSGSAG
jgi:two-component system chemotaxis response regulator CheB